MSNQYHVKQINSLEKSQSVLYSELLSEHWHIPVNDKIYFDSSCDEYSNVIITFGEFLDCNMINEVVLSYSGCFLCRISGRFLCLYSMLTPNFNKKYIKLPFHRKLIAPSQQSLLEIYYNKPDKNMLRASKTIYKNIFEKYMIPPVALEIQQYLGNATKFGKTEIYVNKRIISDTYKNRMRERKDNVEAKSEKIMQDQKIPIETFQTGKSFMISAGNTTGGNSYKFIWKGLKLIFAFRKINAPNTEILPILIRGTLLIDRRVHMRFTKNMVYIADKLTYNDHIPDVEIYTITFENQDYANDNPDEPHSHYFASRSESLTLNVMIEPQKFDVECTVHLLSTNYLLGCRGCI